MKIWVCAGSKGRKEITFGVFRNLLNEERLTRVHSDEALRAVMADSDDVMATAIPFLLCFSFPLNLPSFHCFSLLFGSARSPLLLSFLLSRELYLTFLAFQSSPPHKLSVAPSQLSPSSRKLTSYLSVSFC